MTASIPSPSANGIHLGPFFVHAYGLAYVPAVFAAVAITSRRWERQGGDRALVREVESALAALGCLKVNLQVRASNHGVVRFYERLGYQVEERVSMGKRLYE